MNFHRPVQTVAAQTPIAHRQIVAWGSADGTAKAATGPGDVIIGIADYPGGAGIGDRVDVVRAGITEVVVGAGATVTRGDPVTADALGSAVTAPHHAHPENLAAVYAQNATTGPGALGRIVGYAEFSGVAGDIINVTVAPALI